ncbi:MAG: hypothetical protein H3C39_06605 [Flavobacteriia bacterium]|nr:hypothetical protein [Flavobacteriia bacterium]
MIIQYIDKESLSSLEFLKGKRIQTILSGNFALNYISNIITTTKISIPINNFKGKYLTISNVWNQTQEFGVDYFNLNVRISDTPEEIETSNDKNVKSSLIHHGNFSSLSLRTEAEISKIKIFKYSEKYLGEEVEFDNAILFERRDGLNFLIKNQDSIIEHLEIVTSPEIIDKIITEMEIRLTI